MKLRNRILTIVVLLYCLFCLMPVWAQKTLTVGEVTAEPGEKKSGFIMVPAGKDGPETKIPVTLINFRDSRDVSSISSPLGS